MEVKSISNDGKVCVIGVAGRVDSGNASEFEQKIQELDTAGKLIINLENLEYISSAGLRVFLRLRKKHADMELKEASPEVYEILDMTGFTEMINVTRAYRTISLEGCEVIGQGANGLVYRYDSDNVVKVYKNPDSLDDIQHEREVAKKALLLGIPTAISYDVVRVGGSYASMFEMINAKSLSKILKTEPENIDKYVKLYVDLLKLIHSTVVPKGQLPEYKSTAIGWVEKIKGQLPDDVHAKLSRMVNEIPEDDHMMHGDYHTKNVLIQDGEAILIDMDTICTGSPVFELAGMYNAYEGFGIMDHDDIANFLGFSYDTCQEFWNKSAAMYFGSDDEKYLETQKNKARVLGLAHILAHHIKKHADKNVTDFYAKELTAAIAKADTLVL